MAFPRSPVVPAPSSGDGACTDVQGCCCAAPTCPEPLLLPSQAVPAGVRCGAFPGAQGWGFPQAAEHQDTRADVVKPVAQELLRVPESVSQLSHTIKSFVLIAGSGDETGISSSFLLPGWWRLPCAWRVGQGWRFINSWLGKILSLAR